MLAQSRVKRLCTCDLTPSRTFAPGSCRDSRLDELCFDTFCFSVSALVIGAPRSEWILLPRRASAFREGHKKSSSLFQKICWEEPEKQKTRSPPGAGIIPKQCPMERVEMERGYQCIARRCEGELRRWWV